MSSNQISFLSQHVGEYMLRQLEWMMLQPTQIVVLNHQKGECAELLKKRYVQSEVMSLCGPEANIIPLPPQSVDLIFANLILPWCHDLKKILREWRSVLRPEGLLLFSSLGPDTLMELDSEWRKNLRISLIDMHDLGDELMHARFADPVLHVDPLSVSYRSEQTLRQELHRMDILALDVPDNRQNEQAETCFHLTFEVIYGHAWGPNPLVDDVADEFGVVKIPLAHLRRRN